MSIITRFINWEGTVQYLFESELSRVLPRIRGIYELRLQNAIRGNTFVNQLMLDAYNHQSLAKKMLINTNKISEA